MYYVDFFLICGKISMECYVVERDFIMNKTDTTILDVEQGSLGERAGIIGGDVLLSVNGHEIHDILEYKFLTAEYEIELSIKKQKITPGKSYAGGENPITLFRNLYLH